MKSPTLIRLKFTNVVESRSNCAPAVKVPAAKAIPMAQNTSATVMTTEAMKRGTTRYSLGSAADTRSASNCSVTTMEPISAAMPAPARVASMRAATVGANSRISIWMKLAPSSDSSGSTFLVCRPD